MTPNEAARTLKLEPRASAQDIEQRFLEEKTALEEKRVKALTPGLQERYRAALAEITTAYETLVIAGEAENQISEKSASAPLVAPEGLSRRTPARVLGWHLVGMIKGGVVALGGLFCLLCYSTAANHTALQIPDAYVDGGFTWVMGVLVAVIFPGLFIWQGSVRAAQKLPALTKQYLVTMLALGSVFVAGVVAFQAQRPVAAPASPSSALSPVAGPSLKAATPELGAPAAFAASLVSQGVDCLKGRNGVTQDSAKAVEFFRRAADLGSSDGMFWLASSYEEGEGVPQDLALALKWYDYAAHLGEKNSKEAAERVTSSLAEKQAAMELNNRATALWEGKEVPKDPAKAVELWKQAAAEGIPAAMWGLGLAYESGLGVKRDLAAAWKWYERAAAGGMESAKTKIEELAAAKSEIAEGDPGKKDNTGKLVSLAPGFAGWHGRHLRAPKGFEMLEASEVYIAMPWRLRDQGDRKVIVPGEVAPWFRRMIPAPNLKQAQTLSNINSGTSLFWGFEDTRLLKQKDGMLTRTSDLCGHVGLGRVVTVVVTDWGTGAPDSINVGWGVVAGCASVDEGVEEAFKMAKDGFRKHGGTVMKTAGVQAGISAKIDYEQLRQGGLREENELMPFNLSFGAPGNEESIPEYGLAWQLPQEAQEFVRFVREFPRGERESNQRSGYMQWFGYRDFTNVPRRGLPELVFIEE